MPLMLPLLAISANAYETASPDGNVKATFNVEKGVPTYSVDYKGNKVILPAWGFSSSAPMTSPMVLL